MPNDNVSTLDSVLKQLAARHADEVAQTVRSFLGRVLGNVTAGSAAPTARSKPGVPAKHKTPAPVATAARTTQTAKTRTALRGRTYSPGVPEKVLALITASGGKGPNFYRSESKLDAKAFANVIKKLKADKKIRATGVGSGTTYSAT